MESQNSKDAVQAARNYSDSVEAFIADTVIRQADARIVKSVLYYAYNRYCTASARKSVGRNEFYYLMEAKGFQSLASNGVRYFLGIKLKSDAFPEDSKKPFPLAV